MSNNLPATQKAANIRALLEKSKGQMAMALPKHLTADRLLRVAMTSIQKTPKLLDCTPQSLLACVMTCAQLGLEPDQFLGQAYLVPFKNTKNETVICTLIPGYRGYIALARRSGEVQSVSSQVVYSKDHFSLQYGIEEKLEHVPYEPDEKELESKTPRGDFRGVYVIFKYKDGSYSFDYMGKGEIDRIRKRSKSANDGPWVTDYDEMAKKTVIKRHVKLAPLSVEFAHAAALEDRANAGESQFDLMTTMDNGNVIDADTTEPGEQIEDKAAMIASFDASIPAGTDAEVLADFLTRTAASNKDTIDAVKIEGAKDPAKFWAVFAAYQKQAKHKNGKKPAPETETKTRTIILAPRECPNHPGDTYSAEYCDKCGQRQGCPAWD